MAKTKKQIPGLDFKRAQRRAKLEHVRSLCPSYEEVMEKICELAEQALELESSEQELANTKIASTFKIIGHKVSKAS